MGSGTRLPLLLVLLLGAADTLSSTKVCTTPLSLTAFLPGPGNTAGASSPCEKACNPRLGNLAHGRTLRTETACGSHANEPFCTYAEDAMLRCKPPTCSHCSGAHAGLAHPPAAMADSSFLLPRTWWQAAGDAPQETIQLDLETTFYFTHLILVFKSPRPAAMVLERSQDFGKTWQAYKYFATNCSKAFGLEDDMVQRGAPCTSRYSSPFPCTGGEVIYRTLSPPHAAEDPYSAEAQAQLKVTNLRVRLLERQSCPCHLLEPPPLPALHYAVYDFIVKGSCFCNGHADHCVPVRGFRPIRAAGAFHVVHGKCMCKHNTAGPHCQHCAPLYNDRPWQAADGKTGAPRECQSCKCNGHADTCHFDMDAWLASGNRSGGVCDNCQHNTEGQHCQRCKPGFYRDLRKPFSAPDACKCKCECKEQVLGNSKVFCGMKYTYVIKTKILSAHDKGSHAEVNVKIKKVLKSTKLKILRGKRTLYPESWTNRGCTCPILNPGLEYLVAGHEDVRTGRLIVNMKSFVHQWKSALGRKVLEILKRDCN
ncbi:hypothetical protein ASZ78_012396 [Callipepla squamata]|uniref:Netrin-4 n=1 Tax=Callipepla squamata TaxID=9009 RepID=A0A226MX73_CALSU|nr:hypothetical protein ASZ78_012396 [Callipepla squamata]